MKIFLNFIILTIITVTPGCQSLHLRQIKVKSMAEQAGFQFEQVLSGQFLLTTYKKIKPGTRELVVYIEGDGYAWRRKNILSDNPTPKDPVALKLALKDPRESVLYIARPCQYLTGNQLKSCHLKYWSSHRYADEVIDSINIVIEKEKIKSQIQKINLVGFSGGGTVAVLIATQRNDISTITTVAANLDHARWTEIHKITPLYGSLNASDYISKIDQIPQIHLVGANDDIVPASISESYKQKAGNNKLINIEIINNFDHHCCWEQQWVTLMCKYQLIDAGFCR